LIESSSLEWGYERELVGKEELKAVKKVQAVKEREF
jgi:hypothetical protein